MKSPNSNRHYDGDCRVYEQLLRFGAASEHELIVSCEMTMKSLRSALHRLADRGAVSIDRRAGSQLYLAEPLAHFIDGLKSVRGQNKTGSSSSWNSVRVIMKKVEVVRAIESEVARSSARECIEITDVPAMLRVVKRSELAGLRRTVCRKKIHARGMHLSGKHNKHPYIESSAISPEFTGLSSNIGVYGDSLCLTSFKKGMHTVMIKDESLVKTFRALFEYAYYGLDCLKKVEKK